MVARRRGGGQRQPPVAGPAEPGRAEPARPAAARLDPLLTGLAVLLPWGVFAWFYFGSPVPYAVVAKREIVFSGAIRCSTWVLDSLGFKFSEDPTPAEFALWLTFVLPGALTFVCKRGYDQLLRVITAFTILFPAMLVLGRAPLFEWYLIPLTWCALVVGVQGAFTLGEWLQHAVAGRTWHRAAVPAAAVLCGLVLVPGLIVRDVSTFSLWPEYQENGDGARRRIGEWLGEHTSPGAVIVTEAIGYEGTCARRRIVDLAGVVSPPVVEIHRQSRSNAEAFDRILNRCAPEAVVLRTFEVEQNTDYHGGPLFETPERRECFLAAYEPALKLTAPHPEIWGGWDASITVWRRR